MSNSTHECLGKWRREREGERDLKLIEVYEHRLSINTNFSSKAGYASRINITIDAELGVVKVPSAVFSPSPPPPFFVVYTRVKMLSSVSSPLKSLFRACQWFEGAKLQLEITDIHSFLCCLYLEGFRIPPASRAHPVYDCKNRMWKFMEDVEDDDVWLKVVQSVSFLSPSFFLMRDSSILLTLILRKSCFYRDIVGGIVITYRF